jgi:hypothetical protein
VLYLIFIIGQVVLWSKWQHRGEALEAKRKAIEERTTAYGRPLARKN